MEDITTLGRKEREKIQRKKEIMNVAAELFSVKGFNHTTLEEIAVKAEFGTGTIYNYFQSKEEIFKSIIESIFVTSQELLEKCAAKTNALIEFLRLYTEEVFSYFTQNKEAVLILVSLFTGIGEKPINIKEEFFNARKYKSEKIIVQKIKDGIRNKEIKNLDPEFLSLFYHSTLFPYITSLIKSNKINETEIHLHVEFILDIILNGILVR